MSTKPPTILMARDQDGLAVTCLDPAHLAKELSAISARCPDGAVVAYLPIACQATLARRGAQLVSRGLVGKTMAMTLRIRNQRTDR